LKLKNQLIKASVSLIVLAVLLLTVAVSVQAQEDWEEIVAAAKEEGEVTIYSTTSRVYDAAELFEAEYGIKVDAHRLSEVELIERVRAESQTGQQNMDIVIIEDLTTMRELLIRPGHLVNYIPPEAKANIPEKYHEPLVLGYINRIYGYNTEVYYEEPIENIWQFTDPEWAGRFMIRDPQITGEHLNYFSEIVRRSDEMAASYEEFYGEPLEITEDNAGLEFIKRLAENDPVVMDSDTRISEAVGTRGQEDPPIGFTYVYSKHRDIENKNLALDYMRNIEPNLGYYYGLYVQLASEARHPNAAKVLANFLVGPEGFSPWADDIGVYSMNENVEFHPLDKPWGYWEERLWTYDPDFAAQQRAIITDVWQRSIQ